MERGDPEIPAVSWLPVAVMRKRPPLAVGPSCRKGSLSRPGAFRAGFAKRIGQWREGSARF